MDNPKPEPSLKQQEQLCKYAVDKADSTWPPLRPPRLQIPQRMGVTPTPYPSPELKLYPKVKKGSPV